MGENNGLRKELVRALAAGEELLLAMYLSMRLYLYTFTSFAPESHFLRALLLIVLGLVVLRRGLTLPRKARDDGGLLFPLGLYLAALTASAIHSVHPAASWEKVRFMSEVLLFVVALSDGAYIVPGRRRRVLATVMAAAVVVLIYGLHQKFWGLPDLAAQVLGGTTGTGNIFQSPWAKERLLAYQPFGPFVTSNIMGGYMAMVLPFFAAAAVTGWKKKKHAGAMLMGAAALLGVLMVLWTRSRGAIAALAVGLVILAYTAWVEKPYLLAGRVRLPRAKALFWGMWGLAGAGAVILAIVSPAWSSMGVRGGYWLGGMKALLKYPMGSGPGTFHVIYPRFRPLWGMEARITHNAYLDALFGGGVILLVAFLYVLYRLFKAGNAQVEPLRAAAAPDEKADTPEKETPAPQERPIVPLLHYLGLFLGVLMTGFVFRELTSENIFLALYHGERGAGVISGTVAFILMLAAAPLTAWWVAKRSGGGESTSLMRYAMLAGLLAFMVHCWVDFLWQAEGLVITLAAAAWAVSRRPDGAELPHASAGGNPFTAGRMALVGAGGLTLSIALILGCVMPIDGALALRRATFALEPRLQSVGADLNTLKQAAELHKSHKAKEAAELIRKYGFSSGILLPGGGEKASEKDILVEALQRGDVKPLEDAIGRTEFVLLKYEHELNFALSRFLDQFRNDDRAYYRAFLIRQGLAAAHVDRGKQLAECERLITAALKIVPEAGCYWTAAGETALERGDYVEGAKRLSTATYYYPTSPLRWLAAGDAALLAGESYRAAQFYQRALELNAYTVEEQASLYAVGVHARILRRRSAAVEHDFDAALAASLKVSAEDDEDSLQPYPFFFRGALQELGYGDAAEAAMDFRLLEKVYAEELKQTLRIFQWAALKKTGTSGKTELDELEATITDENNLYILRRLKRGFELTTPGI